MKPMPGGLRDQLELARSHEPLTVLALYETCGNSCTDSGWHTRGWIGYVVGFYLASLARGGDDQAEVLKPSKTFDYCGARQLSAPHEEIEANRHTSIGNTLTCLNNGQVDFDSIAANLGKITPVEKNIPQPIILGRFRRCD